eukprot:COSAG02_NODE_10731_length_1872_cov_1.472645_1_plen_380_part_00
MGWCDLDAKNKDGYTAFLAACSKGHKGHADCMQLLVDAGCDTAVTDNRGRTALMLVTLSGEASLVRIALEAGWCDLEAKEKEGLTAFLVACVKGHVDCMQLLVDAGCNTAATCNGNRSATQILKICGQDEAVQWLREHETQRRAISLQRQARDLLASGNPSEAKTLADKAVSLLPDSTELARLHDEVQSAVAEDFGKRRAAAAIAEAELMAMLDSESTNAPSNCNVAQTQKAQRKKEKRQRQQRLKREAAARRAQAMASSEPEQAPEQFAEPEPEPEYQLVPLSPAVQAPASPCVDSDEALACVRTPPDDFCCPITSECMCDPVMVTATGMTYEREAIVKWLSEHDIDPSTGVDLGGNKLLAPNVTVRKMIDAWSRGYI